MGDLEGAGDVTRSMVIETLSSCLLAWLHTWGSDGFRPVHDHWLYRAYGRDRSIEIEDARGQVIGLDEDGNLMLRGDDGRVVTRAFAPHVMVWA